MKKTIKANESNLIKALKATAKAHRNARFTIDAETHTALIEGDSVPLRADVESIVRSFTKNAHLTTYCSWGFTCVDLYDCKYKKGGLDNMERMQLEMALPYGLRVRWEYETKNA